MDQDALQHIVQNIKASGVLGKSVRQLQLLEYLVDKLLTERSNSVKAYSIAIDVFGRDEQFDPNNDSIVRVEVGRLRRNLELYFATTGKDERYVITIPTGQYLPRIIENSESKNSVAEADTIKPPGDHSFFRPRWAIALLLLLLPISITAGLLYVANDGATSFIPNISITVDANSQSSTSQALQNILRKQITFDEFNRITGDEPADYSIEIYSGNDEHCGRGMFCIQAFSRTGELIGAVKYSQAEQQSARELSVISAAVHEDFFSPRGIIPSHFANADWVRKSNQRLYRCFLDMRYLLVDQKPRYSPTAQATFDCLADRANLPNRDRSYIQVARAKLLLESRKGFIQLEEPKSFDEIEKTIEESKKYAETSAFLLELEMLAERQHPNINRTSLRYAAAKLHEMYKENAHANFLVVSTYLYWLNDTETALSIIKESSLNSYIAFERMKFAHAMVNFMNGNYEEAHRIYLEAPPDTHVVNATYGLAISCHVGDEALTETLRQKLFDGGINTKPAFQAFIKKRLYHPEFEAMLLALPESGCLQLI